MFSLSFFLGCLFVDYHKAPGSVPPFNHFPFYSQEIFKEYGSKGYRHDTVLTMVLREGYSSTLNSLKEIFLTNTELPSELLCILLVVLREKAYQKILSNNVISDNIYLCESIPKCYDYLNNLIP
ncbi:hypothetical protein H8356DRAFT_1426948 [Neocallimastix lanati (nom. inval.)]|nr:hypothetical protein H8356DRAFT_1426948 [Neocallimastix sp. JGI-2020a]